MQVTQVPLPIQFMPQSLHSRIPDTAQCIAREWLADLNFQHNKTCGSDDPHFRPQRRPAVWLRDWEEEGRGKQPMGLNGNHNGV